MSTINVLYFLEEKRCVCVCVCVYTHIFTYIMHNYYLWEE